MYPVIGRIGRFRVLDSAHKLQVDDQFLIDIFDYPWFIFMELYMVLLTSEVTGTFWFLHHISAAPLTVALSMHKNVSFSA